VIEGSFSGVDGGIQVLVRERSSVDSIHNTAVDRMVTIALRDQTAGILVTRIHDACFTVKLSNAVPYGYTEELDSRKSTPEGTRVVGRTLGTDPRSHGNVHHGEKAIRY
jgi:hypothetical protein